MPDLGPHVVPVLAAYSISLVLLFGLVGASVLRARRVKRALDRAEGRSEDG